MFLLCILDGFGLRAEQENNAVSLAKTPHIDKLMADWPSTQIDGSGKNVGLPDGQMGNSEVGHLNFGAGRIVFQDISRIDQSISDGSFFENEVLLESMKKAIATKKAIHLFGLVSDGGVHSSLNHLEALIKMASDLRVPKLYLHAFLDGRDTSPTAGAGYIEQVMGMFKKHEGGSIATIMGRFWGMDRDKRWDRVEKAYAAIVYGVGKAGEIGINCDPVADIKASYAADITDEFVEPIVYGQSGGGRLKSGDLALFFNFRADRVRELNHLFEGNQPLTTIKDKHSPEKLKVDLVNMTFYDEKLSTPKIAFPPNRMPNLFGEIIAQNNLTQLRIAETEKYAHVTYFFNGGLETPFENEERQMVASPRVNTYDLQPEMSSVEVTDKVIAAIKSGRFDVIILNYANCDMVGHTGKLSAAIKAVEAVDTGVGRLFEVLLETGGQAIVTADHGNAEMMVNPVTGGPHTAHTTNLVPCVLVNGPAGRKLSSGGKLADIAPTILDLLNIEKPIEMTGQSLLI